MSGEAKKWRQVPWFRIGAEAVAIIASILIAFSLDAWWDDRQAAEREQWYLLSLNRDFLENRTGLEHVIQVQDTLLQSVRELVLFGATTTPVPGADSVMNLIGRVFGNTTIGFTPNVGTYRELLNTSSLQVIKNDSLRTLLSDFGVQIETIDGIEVGARDGWNRERNEHLLTRLDAAALLPEHMFAPGTTVARRPSQVDYRSLPKDPVFTNVMVGRLAVTEVKISMYRDLQGKVNEILRLLELELSQ